MKIFDYKYNTIKSYKSLEGYVIEKADNSLIIKNYKDRYMVILRVYGANNIKAGDYIIFTGEVRERPYYRVLLMNANNINAYISAYSYEIKIKDRKNIITLPIKFKYRIINGIMSIDDKGGDFICSLLFGYDKNLNNENRESFNQLGISHILAVSGFNIGIIFYFLKYVLKNIPANIRDIISLLLCFIYTFLSGFQPSILRAFLLIVLITIAKIIRRTVDLITMITIVGYIMLIINSYYIYNPGFLLSFSATYGIVLLKNKIKSLFPELKIFKDEAATAISAFIATLPIVLWYNGYVSLISVIVNIMISPLIAFLTILSFTSSIIYAVIRLSFILYPVVYLGSLFINIVNFLTKINSILVFGRPNLVFIISYYILILLFFDFIKYKKEYFYINTVIIFSMVFSLFYNPHTLKIHFLNVGQGDSIFIETPERGSILIDTGPEFSEYSAARDVVAPYIKRCGYNKIDMLVLTHLHNDHAGGFEYLVNNFKVKSVISFKKLIGKNYDFIELSKGDSIKIKNLVIDVLYPDGDEESLEGNETCIVLNLKYKRFSILLTSDAQKSVMDSIEGDFDVVKIPHHGSKESFSDNFFKNSKINIAVISVGKNNFNHPSQMVIEKLKEKGVKVLRTDELGNITIETDGEKYRLYYR
ncbi:DNA internalization-related competence protein ComEC/Rec2 [Caloramator sp. E03]|uniref:DNA internalization-related competence protein ComEC/Rec2 n=1 Tax=Caloramator sp. E03 TaxID=2576307 RepID=UPI00143DC2A0|nr:DNA internalization-related competence protein ComEC/Rec2 [Caloramator sp. E03]